MQLSAALFCHSTQNSSRRVLVQRLHVCRVMSKRCWWCHWSAADRFYQHQHIHICIMSGVLLYMSSAPQFSQRLPALRGPGARSDRLERSSNADVARFELGGVRKPLLTISGLQVKPQCLYTRITSYFSEYTPSLVFSVVVAASCCGNSFFWKYG